MSHLDKKVFGKKTSKESNSLADESFVAVELDSQGNVRRVYVD